MSADVAAYPDGIIIAKVRSFFPNVTVIVPGLRFQVTGFFAETLQVFRSDKDFMQAQAALSKFKQAAMVNGELALKSAPHYRAVWKMGINGCKTTAC